MMDCIPPTENQAWGPRLYLHSTFFLALARFFSLALALALPLRGGTIARAPAKLARWLSMDPRPSPGLNRENPPPHRVPVLLDPAQVAAATAVLEFAIVHGRRSIDALDMPRVDSSDSDSSDDDVSGRARYRHHGYPLIQSLEAGDPRLFFLPGSLPDARQGDAVHR